MASCDVVVIGSGFGGSIPALRLAQDGRQVICLDWGKRNTPKDFRHSFDPRYLLELYVTRNNASYTFFSRYARTLGGGSVMFSGAMYRSPSEVFDYVDSSGTKVWPDEIDRQVLDPHFDTVEQMLQVNQVSWDDVPRTGGVFAKMLDAAGQTCDRGRFNYVDCRQCGFCQAGCIFDRKITLLRTYIPEAEALGAEFRTECFVTHLRPHADGYEVFYKDAWDREQSLTAPQVVLGAGAIETAAILLRSAADLPDLSDQVGHNFGNNGDLALCWLLPESWAALEMHPYMGRDNAGVMCFSYWNEHQVTLHAGSYPPGVFAGIDLHRTGELPWGLDHKNLMREHYDGRMIMALAIGLVDGEGTVGLDDAGQATVESPVTPHLESYVQRVRGIAEEIAEVNGAELLETSSEGFERGDAHPMSTARMATDAERGVCDPFGEVFGYPNLFIADGAAIPGGTGVNPSLTIAANAERIAAHLVENR